MATRTVFMDEWLLAVALDARDRALTDARAGDLRTVAITFAAFAIEASLNYTGSLLSPSWQEYEMLSPRKKALLVHELAKLSSPDFGRRPWQSFSDLFEVRNDIAHGKFRPAIPSTPPTSWEKATEPIALARLLTDAEAIIRDLHRQLAPGHATGVTMSIQTGDAGIVTDSATRLQDSSAPQGPTGPHA